ARGAGDEGLRAAAVVPASARAPAASSSYRYAQLLVPPWKLVSENFSFGACTWSSWRPKPMRMHGRPCVLWNVAMTGIEPPSRINAGFLVHARASARTAAWSIGWSGDVIHGFPPCRSFTVTRTDGGASFRTCASNALNSGAGSWSGTSRMLTLAAAKLGSTVLLPSPV